MCPCILRCVPAAGEAGLCADATRLLCCVHSCKVSHFDELFLYMVILCMLDAVFGSVLLCLTDTDFHIVIPTRSSRFPPPTSFWNAALSVSWARRKRIAMSTAMHLVPSSPRPISAWIQKVKLRLYFRTLWLYYRGNGFRFRANEFWSFVCSIHFLFDGHVCVCCR